MKTRKSFLRFFIRICLIILSAVIGLIGLVCLIATTSPGERVLRGWLERELHDLTGQRIRVGSLETNLLSRLEIGDITVSDSTTGDSLPLLHIERLQLTYSIWSLMHKELALRVVAVDGVQLTVERDNQGGLNYAFQRMLEETPADTTESAFTVTVDSIGLRRLAVNYHDRQIPLRAEARAGSITAMLRNPDEYAFAMTIDSIRAAYKGAAPVNGELSVRGSYSPSNLRVDAASMRLADVLLSGNTDIAIGLDTTITGSMAVTGNPNSLLMVAAAADSLPVVHMDGGFQVEADVIGSLVAPHIRVAANIPKIEIADIQLTDAALLAQWRNDSLFVDSLSCKGFGGRLLAIARAQVDSEFATEATITVESIDLGDLWSTLYHESSPYQGAIGGVVTVAGAGRDFRNWRAGADLQIGRMRYRNQRLPDFTAHLTYVEGEGRVALRQENVHIDARARLDDDRISGDFTAVIPNLEPLAGFFNVFELSGMVDATGTLAGTLDSPAVEAQAGARRIMFQNFPIDTVVARIRYRDSVLFIDRLEFAGALDAIEPENPPFHLDSLTGGFRYAGEISGALEDLQGKLDVDLFTPGFNGYQADSGRISITISGPRIELHPGELFVGSLQLRAEGDVNLNDSAGTCDVGAYDLSSTFSSSIGEITSTFRTLDSTTFALSARGRKFDLGIASRLFPDSLDIGGSLDFDLDFTGNIDKPHARVSIDIAAPRYAAVTLDTLSAAFTFDNDKLDVQAFKARGPHQHLYGHATVQFQRDSVGNFLLAESSQTQGAADGEISDLTILHPFLPIGTTLAGQSAFQLQWGGTLANPHPEGWFTVSDGRFQASPEAEPVSKINLRVALRDTQIVIDTASGEIFNRLMRVEGSATIVDRSKLQTDLVITPQGTGGGKVTGLFSSDSLDVLIRIEQFDLSPLVSFVPDIDSLNGFLDCRLELRGEAAAPELKGFLTASGLAARSATYPITARNGVVRLSFDWNRVSIDSLFAQLNDGTASVTGSLAYDTGQITDLNLQIAVDELKVENPREYQVYLQSARLSYTRPGGYFLLGGDIQLGESRFLARVKPQAILPWAQSVERAAPELPPFLEQTRLDIRIREIDQLWVDNNVARLRMHTDMRIIGSPVKPNFAGRVNVEEGYVLYLDRKFDIKTGNILFLDPNRFNPELDLRAESQVTSYQATEGSKYLITFSVSGTLDELVMSLTSQPPLDNADIVALLTVGATRSELLGKDGNGQGGGATDVLKSRAETLASRQISGYLGRKAGDFLGLDQVTVEGNLFQAEGASKARFLASKKISDRVELTYSTTVGYLNDQSFRLDYKLSERFSLEGQTDQRGRSSANLKYRLLFR